jgi:hypothetical protein
MKTVGIVLALSDLFKFVTTYQREQCVNEVLPYVSAILVLHKGKALNITEDNTSCKGLRFALAVRLLDDNLTIVAGRFLPGVYHKHRDL